MKRALAAGAATLGLVAAASMLAWQADSPLVPRDGGLADQGTAWPFFLLLVAAMVAYVLGLVLLRRGAVALRPVLAIAVAVQPRAAARSVGQSPHVGAPCVLAPSHPAPPADEPSP